MRTEFMMSSESLASEASEWLGTVGVLAQSSTTSPARLVVDHDDEMARDVRRIVEIVDPAAGQVR